MTKRVSMRERGVVAENDCARLPVTAAAAAAAVAAAASAAAAVAAAAGGSSSVRKVDPEEI
jgi:3-oxoacyl-ACP reductase-like protein